MNQATKISKSGNPLGYEPIGKLLRIFALPAVISMLVNAVYNIVDQIFIGQRVGYLGNAATTVAFPIVSIVLAIATLIGAGGSAYASIKLGEKRDEEAQQTLGNVLVLSVLSGIILAVIGLVFLRPIITLFGATDANMEYSIQYAAIIFIGLPFNVLGISLSNMARTDGSPALSMYSIVIGAVLNCVLDPLYIFVFHWLSAELQSQPFLHRFFQRSSCYITFGKRASICAFARQTCVYSRILCKEYYLWAFPAVSHSQHRQLCKSY